MSGRPVGPVVSSDLYSIQMLKLDTEIRGRLDAPLRRLTEEATGHLAQMLRRAYLDGLRDGFSQGLVAEREDEE